MAVIILIGPSHAGKTTLGKRVSCALKAEYHDMDIEAKVRMSDYMDNAKQLLEKYSSTEERHILDFGAGYQNHEDSYGLFKPFSDFMITIWEKPEILFQHHKLGNTKLRFEDFSNIEYREARQKIYNMAKYRLERTWDDIEGDVVKLEKLLRTLFYQD